MFRLSALLLGPCLLGSSSASQQPDIVVGLIPGAQISTVVAGRNLTVVDSIPGIQAFLVAPPPGTSVAERRNITLSLASASTVTYAELDRPTASPESSGCGTWRHTALVEGVQGGLAGGARGSASTQHCTIGIVDGSPSSARYLAQDWMSSIRLASAQSFPPSYPNVVAVVDTGVDLEHPDLALRVLPGYDFVLGRPEGRETRNGLDDDGDGLVDEAFGHGTHVSGTIALVDPWATILPLRALDEEGNGSAFVVAKAIHHAADVRVDAINLSLSTKRHSQVIADACHRAVTLGIGVVTSAGNTGSRVLFPASLDSAYPTLFRVPPVYVHGVIAVAATGNDDVLAPFSAWGHEIDVSAPGVSIYSTYPDQGYAWWSGTSMACAVATGVVSLSGSVSSYPTLSTAETVAETATPIDEVNPGHAGGLGEGRVDALAAVAGGVAPRPPVRLAPELRQGN